MTVVCGGSGMYVENALNGLLMPEVPSNLELRDSLKNKSLDELTEILKQSKTLHNTTDVDTVQRAVRAIEIMEYYKEHPEQAELADKNKAQKLNSLVIGMDIPREERRRSISLRLHQRLDSGMVEEVKGLIERGVDPEALIYYGLEYKFLTLYVIGKLTYDEMFNGLETAIHQFAKRQMTWFRGMEKRGTKIHWLPYNISEEKFIKEVSSLL